MDLGAQIPDEWEALIEALSFSVSSVGAAFDL